MTRFLPSARVCASDGGGESSASNTDQTMEESIGSSAEGDDDASSDDDDAGSSDSDGILDIIRVEPETDFITMDLAVDGRIQMQALGPVAVRGERGCAAIECSRRKTSECAGLPEGRSAAPALVDSGGPSHPRLADVHLRLARGLRHSGALAKAGEHVHRALKIVAEHFGDRHYLSWPIWLESGNVSLAEGAYERAYSAFARALECFDGDRAQGHLLAPVFRGLAQASAAAIAREPSTGAARPAASHWLKLAREASAARESRGAVQMPREPPPASSSLVVR